MLTKLIADIAHLSKIQHDAREKFSIGSHATFAHFRPCFICTRMIVSGWIGGGVLLCNDCYYPTAIINKQTNGEYLTMYPEIHKQATESILRSFAHAMFTRAIAWINLHINVTCEVCGKQNVVNCQWCNAADSGCHVARACSMCVITIDRRVRDIASVTPVINMITQQISVMDVRRYLTCAIYEARLNQ